MAVVRAYAYLLSGRPAQALKACLTTAAARLTVCTLTQFDMANLCACCGGTVQFFAKQAWLQADNA